MGFFERIFGTSKKDELIKQKETSPLPQPPITPDVDSTGRVYCTNCGTSILLATYKKHNGLCAPCSSSTIEREKRRVMVEPLQRPSKEDHSQRGKLERLVLTYLKASHYLATCGKFNEKKFDKVEQILSTHEWYTPNPTKISEIKAQVKNLIVTDTELVGWDHMKVREHQSLSEAITAFLRTMKQDFPDVRTQEFIKRVIAEGDEITRLISTTKDQ